MTQPVTDRRAARGRPRAADRDRRWIAYVQLSFYAWFLYAFGATQALLRDEEGTTRSVAALHGTTLAVGGLIGALLCARAIDLVGRGHVMRIAAVGASIGILVYTAPGGLPVTPPRRRADLAVRHDRC